MPVQLPHPSWLYSDNGCGNISGREVLLLHDAHFPACPYLGRRHGARFENIIAVDRAGTLRGRLLLLGQRSRQIRGKNKQFPLGYVVEGRLWSIEVLGQNLFRRVLEPVRQ